MRIIKVVLAVILFMSVIAANTLKIKENIYVLTTQFEIQPTIEKIEVVEEMKVNKRDLWLLAHLINGEAGATYCSDKMREYVGSVALNRVNYYTHPDTLEEVIFQDGQYQCTWDGNFYKEPTQKCYDIAEDLLLNGSCLPVNVVFQSEFEQGDGVYCTEQNMIFCYTICCGAEWD